VGEVDTATLCSTRDCGTARRRDGKVHVAILPPRFSKKQDCQTPGAASIKPQYYKGAWSDWEQLGLERSNCGSDIGGNRPWSLNLSVSIITTERAFNQLTVCNCPSNCNPPRKHQAGGLQEQRLREQISDGSAWEKLHTLVVRCSSRDCGTPLGFTVSITQLGNA
jgi:hypothetical protein